MLQDIERKVLSILRNVSYCRGRLPSIHEIGIKTGRSHAGIYEALSALATERYIEWNAADPERIILLEEWERPDIRPAGRSSYGEI